MNKDQFLQVSAPFLAFIGGLVVGKGWLTTEQWGQLAHLVTEYGPYLLPVIIGAFAWVKNRWSKKALDANAIPGVQVIVDRSQAPKEVVAVAMKQDNSLEVKP